MFNLHDSSVRKPSMFRRFTNMLDAAVSTTVEGIVSAAESAATSTLLIRLRDEVTHYDDRTLIEHMVEHKPSVKNLFENSDSSALNRLSDSIEVLITEYRIRIRVVRRTGENQYRLLEQNILHNCEYIQTSFTTATDEFVQNFSDEIETQKFKVIIAAEDQVNEIKNTFSNWFDNLTDDFDNYRDEIVDAVRTRVDDAREKIDDITEYIEEELVDDIDRGVLKLDEKIEFFDGITRAHFELDMGVISEEPYDANIPVLQIVDVPIVNTDYREEIEERPDDGFIDKFLIGAFDLAPSLENYDYKLPPFVKEKFQKAVFEYKYNPSLYNAYVLVNTLEDCGYEPVFVEVHPIEKFSIEPTGNNYYDVRSDFHNSGKLTRHCDTLVKYQVTTTELCRDIKPLFYWKILKEAFRTYLNEGDVPFCLGNIIQERQHVNNILVSPDMLNQICSPKTMGIHTSFSKFQLNIDLAIRNNSSVNLPYNMSYSQFPIRENTAHLAYAVRDSMLWNNYGNGLNFQL